MDGDADYVEVPLHRQVLCSHWQWLQTSEYPEPPVFFQSDQILSLNGFCQYIFLWYCPAEDDDSDDDDGGDNEGEDDEDDADDDNDNDNDDDNDDADDDNNDDETLMRFLETSHLGDSGIVQ